MIPSAALDALKTPTVYQALSTPSLTKTYSSGLVFDTRDFTQSAVNDFFPPAMTGDSGVSSMQHMVLIRTFLLPDSVTVSDGTVASVVPADHALAVAQRGARYPCSP